MNLEKLKSSLADIRTRIRMLFTRAQVTHVYVINQGKMRDLQARGLAGELTDEVQHAEAYGLASFPLAGAEAFLSEVLGQRGNLIATIVSDPRYRPTGDKPGEVVVWSKYGQTVWLHDDGTLTVSAPNTVKVTAPKVEVEAPEVAVTATDVTVNASNVAIVAESASLDCSDISFGGEGGQPVARVGDLVEITAGSSAGTYQIISGSEKMRVA